MTECRNCLLPANFPGLRLDETGLCNLCRDFKGLEHQAAQQAELRTRFEAQLRPVQGRFAYDVLLCYSGGKDSTYTLALLREQYRLRVLAFTVDNGFVSEQALINIRRVTEALDADSLMWKPRAGLLRKVFAHCVDHNPYSAKSLERATAICTSCMAFVKFGALRLALEKKIPFIAYGWSPGQAPLASALMKNNAEMLRLTQSAVFEPLLEIAGEEVRPYFPDEALYAGTDDFPTNVSPLAFTPYREQDIVRRIQDFGWKAPAETDANSTNCLLNSFSNRNHLARYGFHPYALEIAGLIRKGAMTREEGRRKLSEPENQDVVAEVRRRLGLPPEGGPARPRH